MKRILALAFTLVFLFALCACGSTPSTNDNTTVGNTDTTDGNSVNSATDNTEKTGYVDTWIYEKETAQGPFKITLVINEDGTAVRTVGKTETHLIWYVDEDSDHGEGAIEIAKEETRGYGDDAYITEDGKLYLESTGSILGEPYDHLVFQRQ